MAFSYVNKLIYNRLTNTFGVVTEDVEGVATRIFWETKTEPTTYPSFILPTGILTGALVLVKTLS